MIMSAPEQSVPPAFHIGAIPIYRKLILAPMDGYSDHPFRLICRRWGSACTYSEFINAMDLEGKQHPHIGGRLFFSEEERPFGYQILDNSPDRILIAAQILRERNPDFIDVNLGCCSRSVCSRGAGARLLVEPEKISLILDSLVKNLDIPVTAKIRLGWDEKNRNYLEVARRVEQSGVSALAVHGRTKIQAYTGMADWDAIAQVKQVVSIPVIGNGDVKTANDISRFLSHTDCDAIMIGRGAIGNPWIFSGKDQQDCSKEEIYRTMVEHLEASINYYGEDHGLVVFRKQAVLYVKNEWPSPATRHEALTTRDRIRFLQIIRSILLD
ncbi:tRNA-dihydrouridine synthase [Leptolinea tardivitalis]|nr:tRNA-dihydrouridine synthase [Leptolinea tardivitalis]